MKSARRWIVLSVLIVAAVVAWLIARQAMAPDDSPRGLARQLGLADQPPGTIDTVAAALRLRPPRPTKDAILRRLVAAGSEAVGPLTEMLSDEDPFVRALGARALYRMGPPAAKGVPDLVKAMREDADPQVRIWSAGALGEIGLPAAEPAMPDILHALRNDENPGVRRSAAVALGRFGPGAAAGVGPLIEALNDPDVTVHPYAAEALGRIGAADDRVVGALKAAVGDQYARARAVEALAKLGVEAPATAPATRPVAEHPTRPHSHGT